MTNKELLSMFRYLCVFFGGIAFEQSQYFLLIMCLFCALFAHKVFEDEKNN